MYIDFEELKRIHDDSLKMKLSGYTLDKVMENRFRTSFYKKCGCYVIDLHNLELLIGRKIECKNIQKSPIIDSSNIRRDGDLAEFVGIMLGDGGLYLEKYKMEISLNHVDELEYISYVYLLIKKLFNINPKLLKRKGKDGKLRIYNKSIFYIMKEIGIVDGDKVKNQVSVPDWIKKDLVLMTRCLCGLLDTDGCIYIKKQSNTNETIAINFSNRSIPLLNDFIYMCNNIGINTSKISNGNVHIISKENVRSFLEKVNPFKWRLMLDKNPNISSKLEYKNIKSNIDC